MLFIVKLRGVATNKEGLFVTPVRSRQFDMKVCYRKDEAQNSSEKKER
jgi:hypothetical protein